MIKLKNILNEATKLDTDAIMDMEKVMKDITGYPVSVSERMPGPEYRVKWAYIKGELPDSKWKAAIKYIEDELKGVIDPNRSKNSYEANWEREEPPEWVPTIYFVPHKIQSIGLKR